MGKTLVTGATGHLGANLVRALLDRGEAVRCLVLPGDRAEALEGLDLERAEGDLRDEASLARAVAGCDYVYHLAAHLSLRSGDKHALQAVNVTGSRNLFDAAERAGVKRIVHCSSFGAVATQRDVASDERDTIDPFDLHLDYELSKAISEIEALRAAVRGVDVVIVNPSGIVGPWDFGPSSFGQTLLDFGRGRMKVYVEGRFEFVAVRDVVAGHLLAMEKGRRGERYILSGELLTLDQHLQWMHELTGAPLPRWKLPARVLYPLSFVSNAVMKRFFPNRPPRFTPGTIRLLTSGKRADTSKARAELGWASTPVRDALAEQLEWFRQRGML